MSSARIRKYMSTEVKKIQNNTSPLRATLVEGEALLALSVGGLYVLTQSARNISTAVAIQSSGQPWERK
jgi:hypothetical protein